MAIIVEKYGGTSVGSVERINAVARNVASSVINGDSLVVVVSAMSGETDRLVAMARDITRNPSRREMDVLVSTGEQVTIALLVMALEQSGTPACSFTGFQVPIHTDNIHGKARIENIEVDRVKTELT